jgi:hypothetical protein
LFAAGVTVHNVVLSGYKATAYEFTALVTGSYPQPDYSSLNQLWFFS